MRVCVPVCHSVTAFSMSCSLVFVSLSDRAESEVTRHGHRVREGLTNVNNLNSARGEGLHSIFTMPFPF